MTNRKPATAEFAKLLSMVQDAHKTWNVGDTVKDYRLTGTSTIERFEARSHGRIAYLANGESMHESKLRRP